MYAPINLNQKKVDQSFFNSYNKLRQNNILIRIFYSIRLIASTVYLVIHLMSQKQNEITYNELTSFLALAILTNLCNFLYVFWYSNYVLGDTFSILNIADLIGHAAPFNKQDENSFQIKQNMYVCKEIYQFQTNLLSNQVLPMHSNMIQRNCITLIVNLIQQQYCIVRFFNQIFNMTAVGMFAYGIVVMAEGNNSAFQLAFIITYIITQFLSRFIIFFILILLALSPLICLCLCTVMCCCSHEQQYRLPQKIQATQQIIVECGGQCPICYQSIKQKQEIIVLRCSPKHVFHQLCIKGWTKMRPNCPNCRQKIGN